MRAAVRRRAGCAALVLALLAGCATRPLAPPTGEVPDPGALQHWRVQGKLGYRAPRDNGSAWISWRQDGADWELRLHGPFGAGATRIHGDGEQAVLERAGEQPLKATSAAALSTRLFGWTFPVAEMRAWIRGLPAPDTPVDAIQRNDAGRVTTLTQSGWQLSFDDYGRHGYRQLPGKIRGRRDALSFTLVINDWRPGPDR